MPKDFYEVFDELSEQINHDIVESVLSDNKMDINAQDDEGHTFLMLACANGDNKTVKKLIEKGADTGITDSDGRKALHHAFSAGESESIRLMLEKDKDIDAKDNKGQTCLHIVCEKQSRKSYGDETRENNIKKLLIIGAKTDIKDKNGNIALELSSLEDRASTAELFINKRQLSEEKDLDQPESKRMRT